MGRVDDDANNAVALGVCRCRSSPALLSNIDCSLLCVVKPFVRSVALLVCFLHIPSRYAFSSSPFDCSGCAVCSPCVLCSGRDLDCRIEPLSFLPRFSPQRRSEDMTVHSDGDLEATIAALSERVRREIELVDAQIAKSRSARGYVPTEGTPAKPVAASGVPQTPPAKGPTATVVIEEAAPSVTPAAAVGQKPSTDDTGSPSSSPQLDLQQKGGPLLNFGRSRVLQSFKPCYFVVDSAKGFMWWENVDAFRRGPTTPSDSIPFFEITTNSRASKFKKAVTCWPLILPEDCSKATDKTIHYFGLEYVNPRSKDGKSELLVLGAASEAEKNAWITYMTKHVKLFLANRMESEAFLDFPVGSKTPQHVSAVLDGEAPR
jgi:hypothetical protein